MNDKKIVGHVAFKTKFRRAIWNVTAAVLFRPFVTGLFRPWRNILLRAFGAKIDMEANVYASVKIWAPWNLSMGRGSCLGPNVICYNQDMVVLEEDAIVSQYSYLCTASHDTSKQNTADDSLVIAPIVLKKGAWVGASAFIGLGVCIGENAIVGARAAVFKDVEPWTIVGGNPAKYIKMRELKMLNGGVI